MKLLELSGKDLEKELDKMIAENQVNYHHWTEKEVSVLKRLFEGGVPLLKISSLLGLKVGTVQNKVTRSRLHHRLEGGTVK